MTSTLTRTSQAVAEWSKVFPCQATETYTSSVTFIKQLTVVAVSTITYLKNAFPEDNYTVDQFGGLKIRVLKNKCEDELAQFLITSLTQAFEAFDKKYLHQIALCFYEHECAPENLLEYHLFEYAYGPAGASLSVRSSGRAGDAGAVTLDAVRDRTVQLLRACMVMLSHTQLPETYDVSLRLYYNDDAPEGYQAPGFAACARAEPAGAGRVKLGSVRTPFHRLQLHTYQRDLRPGTPDASENTPALSQQDEFASSAQATGDMSEMGVPESGAGNVRCECGRTDMHLDALMRTCSYCGMLQHAVCYGELRAARGAHCCVPCGEAPGRRADPGLARAANRPCYAIFRRALAWLRSIADGALSVDALGGALALSAGSARKLMRVLRAHGVLSADPPADPAGAVGLVPAQLEAAVSRYFREPAEPRLLPLPERAADDPPGALLDPPGALLDPPGALLDPPGALLDPLGAVLSPLERVSLQAAAGSGRVLAPTEPDATLAEQDATLAQYRSALAPLAGERSPAAILRSPARKRKQDGGRKPGVRTKRVKRASRD